MILKHKDNLASPYAELERLLALPKLSKAQREEIEDEIGAMRGGEKGEKEAAYHIDFAWKNGKNTAVIHDLRIEHGGRVAQIDHLILTRTLDCHVLESKGFSRELRVSESSEWETKTRYGWKGIPSPVEQNRRHIEVLQSFVRDHQLAPRRLGLPLPLKFHNWVVVAPGCSIRRKGEGWDQVVKMDLFEKEFFKQIDREGVLETFVSITKFVSADTVVELAQALIRAHKPATFNFAAKFGISEEALAESKYAPALQRESSSSAACESCSAPLETKVINFCRLNSKKFGGKLLCQTCQKQKARTIVCESCSAELDEKVVAFCRFNSKRFGGKKLCRECQRAITSV